MNQCSRGPLAATVFLFVFVSVVVGQGGPAISQPCDDECQQACQDLACEAAEEARLAELAASGGIGLAVYDVCNTDLQDVQDFVLTVYDADCNVVTEGTTGTRLCTPNLTVAALLSRLDIDGDGIADNAPDTDGDGLPDNWERGGAEARTADNLELDRIVYYPAPSAIVPGTPPTPIFTRLAVATDALNADTDGDGLSDFIEVFGLMFIDENRNGLLDGGEWMDKNSDGLPSPGEYPVDNSDTPDVLHDFDGFIFTDPTNRDTDGDGQLDGDDNDPLINPRAFGNPGTIIVRLNAEGNADIDKDGLGNGMDMGNDLTSEEGPGLPDFFQMIDNPENLQELLELFRPDLLDDGIVPEAQVEDLFGADWDGNGLWRTTDMRTWSLVIDPNDPAATPPDELFALVPDDPNSHRFYATQTFDDLRTAFTDEGCDSYGKRGIGMGWQDLLVPSGRTDFLPDGLVWAILYAWRVPGFDIDGDGFIGVPNLSSTAAAGQNAQGEDIASVALKRDPVTGECTISNEVLVTGMAAEDRPFDDRVDIFEGDVEQGEPEFDGIIEAPDGFPALPRCGSFGLIILLAMVIVLAVPKLLRRR